MCGRYANHIDDLKDWASLLEHWPGGVATGYNVAPTRIVPVYTRDGCRGMRWGLVPQWSKVPNPRYATFNARAESLAEKPAFRDAWRRQRRCLIPALGYYEWRLEGTAKQPYFVQAADGNPLVFGGLWEPPASVSGAGCSCTIVTREALGPMRSLHARTPHCIDLESVQRWLDGSTDQAEEMMTLPPVVELVFHPVGRAVNNVRNESADLVRAVG